VCRSIFRKDKNQFFHLPVDLIQVPQYAEIIQEPMDLSTVEKKVDSYKSFEGFKVCGLLSIENYADGCVARHELNMEQLHEIQRRRDAIL
jgi:hypothetical protein